MKSIIQLFIIALGVLFTLGFSGCEKDVVEEAKKETDSIMDVDGNVYTTVKIGNQWWMAEDLKVQRFKNGDIIDNGQSLNAWQSATASFCLFDGNAIAPGLLYNWYAVNHSSGLAPEGWHVANEADWQALELFLGMNQTSISKYNWREEGGCGDKLKAKGPRGWTKFEGVWGTAESGFDAIGGGCRLSNGNWSFPGINATGFWWTSTENTENPSSAYFRNLDYKKSGVFRFYIDKQYGMAVRCVKNN